MKTHNSFVVSFVAAAALSVAVGAGCQKDPNVNSMVFRDIDAGGPPPDPNGPIIGGAIATFDMNGEGFALEMFHDTAQVNLGDPASGASPAPMLTWDGSTGNPQPGSLKVTAPYSGASQYVDIQKLFGTTNLQNWSGRTMHVRIKAAEGTFAGGAQIYIKTGTAYVFGGQYTNYTGAGNWQEFTIPVDNPTTSKNAGYDPTQVIAYGLQINSGSSGASQKAVTFQIDSFSLDPPLAPTTTDAGTQDRGSTTDTGGATDTGGTDDAAAATDASAG